MHTILILGSGRSATCLIDYLAESCLVKSRNLILADINFRSASEKLQSRPNTAAHLLDIQNGANRRGLISKANAVISMLPASLHPLIAKDCLELGKHFFSASYESAEIRAMKSEITHKKLFFLNECGLDPGIDHMSAMKIIHAAKANGDRIISFKSYCGGLLAPGSEDNPWKYKFTWNPRNVVLAGQGTSRYMENGELKSVSYHQLFNRLETVSFGALGDFEGYPNRDSLNYREAYQLTNVQTMLRGTLRRPGYCAAWNVFVQLGMCDDTYEVNLPEGTTLRQFLNTFLPYHPTLSVEEKLAELMDNFTFGCWEKIQWLGFFSNGPLPKVTGSPASILQAILEKNWKLYPEDKDMIIMKHIFDIQTDKGLKRVTSSLICYGEDSTYTALAKTVGLPLAIAVDLFLDGKINQFGLHVPVIPEIYRPILAELEPLGIVFKEKVNVQPI